MKRSMLSGYLLIVACTCARAQAPGDGSTVSAVQGKTSTELVSKRLKTKTEFISAVEQLKQQLTENRTDEANATWTLLLHRMNAEFQEIERQILEARSQKNHDMQDQLDANMKRRAAAANDIIVLQAEMEKNKTQLYSQLIDFASEIN